MKSFLLNPKITYLAITNFRKTGDYFGIYQKDRLMHLYILGKTGTGKTTLQEHIIRQDIFYRRGITVFDIHGDLTKHLLPLVHQLDRSSDLIHFDVSNPHLDLGYNPLRKVSYSKRSLVCSGILKVLERLWGKSAWGSKMEHILRMVLLTLLDQPKADFSCIIRILEDKQYRDMCQKHIVNKDICRFWSQEFERYSKTELLPIYNKIGGFLAHPVTRKILIENPRRISLRKVMDTQKILMLDFSKGTLGADAAAILSGLFLTSLSAAAFSRIDTPENKRKPHFVFLDEFQHYSFSLEEMLSELRKFKIGLTVSHQYLGQLTKEVREAVLGNIGTIICFRLGQADAKYMAQEFYPVFEASDFTSLENFEIYLRLMIQGKPSKPFSASTLRV